MNYQCDLTISCPPEKVWDVIIKTKHYGDWHPFLYGFYGRLRFRKKLSYRCKGYLFKNVIRINRFKNEKEIGWIDSLFMFGLADRQFIMRLSNSNDGHTTIYFETKCQGLLCKIIHRLYYQKLTNAMKLHLKAIKNQAENYKMN